jgi:hypothetical protein
MARPRGPRTGDTFRAIGEQAEKRRQARTSPFERFAGRTGFEWEGVSAAALTDGLAHALTRGTTVTFSLTKDGGAVKVSLWIDNAKSEAWAGNADVLNELMESLTEVTEPAAD